MLEIRAPLEQTASGFSLTGFAVTPSLDILIRFWRQEAEANAFGLGSVARELSAKVDAIPELSGPLRPAVISEHPDLVKTLMTAVCPASLQRLSCSGVATPGTFDFHYATPRFARELLDERGELRGRLNLDEDLDFVYLATLFTYVHIARMFYNIDFNFAKTVQIVQADPVTGFERYYQMRAHFDLLEFRTRGPLPPLPPDAEALLTPRLTDVAFWEELIPKRYFEMYGMVVYEATDMTEEMTLSAIKQDLVAKDPLLSGERFSSLARRLRSLLGVEDLMVTLTGMVGKQVFKLRGQTENLDLASIMPVDVDELLSTVCRETLLEGKPILLDDLSTARRCSKAMDDALGQGFRTMLMMPLVLGGEMTGVMTLLSRKPRALNALTPVRLKETLPLMALAVMRTLDSVRNRVETVMKERFTAIHPAVEWRFRASAEDVVRGRGSADEDIVFPDVYPLFACSDIRNSTILRNRCIQCDLTDQLALAGQVLESAYQSRPLPYLASRQHRVAHWIEAIEPGLNSSDEPRILEFLKHEIEPLFNSLNDFGPEVERAIARYRDSLDANLGLVYRERRKYEESMAAIRDLISSLLYEQQAEAQAIFPHYFEVHKTDGVDHTIYVGAAMTQGGRFDRLYVKNLRLWQLMVVADVARRTREVESDLPLRLETAHLILVQDSPLSIRFTQDEKQFNVDGAYNARYEILKKRLDKAEIRDSGERLTQPGKVAIVYSHPREQAEYREYIEYLQAIGRLEERVEDLEIAPLQGVHGLRALRVSVKGTAPASNPSQSDDFDGLDISNNLF